MPEIAEARKLAKDFDALWAGRRILSIKQIGTIPWGKYVQDVDPSIFWANVTASTVQKVHRHGKAICLSLSSGFCWRIHLSSTGWFRQVKDVGLKQEPDREFLHSTEPTTYRVQFKLDDGQEWVYCDGRTWGKWHLYKGKDPRFDPTIEAMGPDWIDDPEAATAALLTHRGNRTVKDVLCDQELAAGVGNYLACEACFIAEIHPHTRWKKLEPEQIDRLSKAVLRVIKEAVDGKSMTEWYVFKKLNEP